MKRLLPVLSVLLLAACGWHLRGAPAFTGLDSVTVSGGGGELRHLLEQNLEQSGVAVHADAPWKLAIQTDRWDERTVAVDNQGRPAEKELRLSLRWQLLRAADGKPMAPKRHLTISRSYRYSSGNATSASDEADRLRQDIYQDAIWQVMRQLEVSARDLPPPEPAKNATQD